MNEKKKYRVYLDYAAGAPLEQDVRDAMRAYDDAHFANAFSIHDAGKEAKRVLEDARFRIAAHLGARTDECFFASGATDAMTKIVYGVVNRLLEKGVAIGEMHIVISALEHSTVRSCVEGFARRGIQISVVGASPDGRVDLDQFRSVLRDNTILAICMLVNNEVGTIQPVRDIARMLRDWGSANIARFSMHGIAKPFLVVDASQALLSMRVAPAELGADFLVVEGGKIYGPKRAALLYARSGTSFQSLCGMHGTVPSEGTPDVASVVGFRAAYDIAERRRDEDILMWQELKTYFLRLLADRFPGFKVNGSPDVAIPNILNVSFPKVEGEFLAARLNEEGIAASAKSACLSGGGEGSYVVAALAPERANDSIRFSFGRETTQEDIDYTVSVLADIVPTVAAKKIS